jgi:hypothetical protein
MLHVTDAPGRTMVTVDPLPGPGAAEAGTGTGIGPEVRFRDLVVAGQHVLGAASEAGVNLEHAGVVGDIGGAGEGGKLLRNGGVRLQRDGRAGACDEAQGAGRGRRMSGIDAHEA